MIVLVSPSDSEFAKAYGDEAKLSTIPEEKGADILLYTTQGLFGIQRKKAPHDFLSSVEDGRMTRCTSLLYETCKFRTLVIEEKFRYLPNTHVILGPRRESRFTRAMVKAIIMDIKYVKGVDVDFTDDLQDTVLYVKTLARFFADEKHMGLFRRPSAKGSWIIPSANEIDLWILQSFMGIGPASAEKIAQLCGSGRAPLAWTCTLEQLKGVPGLGEKKAHQIWDQLMTARKEAGGSIPIARTQSTPIVPVIKPASIDEVGNILANLLKGLG